MGLLRAASRLSPRRMEAGPSRPSLPASTPHRRRREPLHSTICSKTWTRATARHRSTATIRRLQSPTSLTRAPVPRSSAASSSSPQRISAKRRLLRSRSRALAPARTSRSARPRLPRAVARRSSSTLNCRTFRTRTSSATSRRTSLRPPTTTRCSTCAPRRRPSWPAGPGLPSGVARRSISALDRRTFPPRTSSATSRGTSPCPATTPRCSTCAPRWRRHPEAAPADGSSTPQ